MASSRLQLISKKLVKPSLSTPLSLRNYKLSLIDQLMMDQYMPMAFFYPNNGQHHNNNNNNNKHPQNTSQISSVLQESLSRTLSFYYPFAGSLTNNISVDCNDTGATFVEARIGCQMSEILEAQNENVHDILFPSGIPWSFRRDPQQSLVVAQLSHFDCGGKAVSLCINHKIADANTLCNFANDWAAVARQPSLDPSPQLCGASILPPRDDPPNSIYFEEQPNLIARCFVFDRDKLIQLKAKASSESGVEKPSRTEVVNALLYKCAMAASAVSSGSSFKPSHFGFMLNFRPLIGLPASQNFVGNFASACFISATDETQMNYSRLVREMRREKLEKYEKYRRIQKDDLVSTVFEDVREVKLFHSDDGFEKHGSSSLCGFPITNIDFGWGRPVKVSFTSYRHSSTFILLDNHVGGVDALVTLEDQVMSLFQNDSELVTFATPYPRLSN